MPKFSKNTPAKKDDDGNEVIVHTGTNLPQITEPRCKVCTSPFRTEIEIQVARGYSFAKIAESLQDAGQDISYRSIQRHRDKHMTMKDQAFRQIMEKQAQELSEAEAQGAVRIVSGKAWLDLFIQQATDLLIAGEMEIEARDVVKAIELRELLDKEGVTFFREQIMVELRAIIQAMKEIIAPELARQISVRAKELAQEIRHAELEAGTEEAEFEEVTP